MLIITSNNILFPFLTLVSTGGAGLRCKIEPDSLKKCDTLHLWASTKRLLEGAEKFKVKKSHISGAMLDFSLDNCNEFKGFGSDGEGFLTTSESQWIIQCSLDAIKCHMDMTVPGYTEITLYKNRAIGEFFCK